MNFKLINDLLSAHAEYLAARDERFNGGETDDEKLERVTRRFEELENEVRREIFLSQCVDQG